MLVVDYFGPSGNPRRADMGQIARFERVDDLKKGSSEALGNYRDARGDPRRWCRIRTDVDISGTYLAETSAASGDRLPKEGWRMLTTTFDTGPHYVEMVGPAATVARWEPSYRRFVDSAKPLGWRSRSGAPFPDARGLLR